MWEVWPSESPKLSSKHYEQLNKIKCEPRPEVRLQQVLQASDLFPVVFPIDSMRCKRLINEVSQNQLEKNINSVYPVIHEQVMVLYLDFLEHKRKFGTDIERKLYKGMTLEMLVDRLIKKRAVSFVGPRDVYALMDGCTHQGNWESIGTSAEQEPLTLQNCLSYDEIKLSALLPVSSYTQFINVGDRRNSGKIEEDKSKFEENGIIVGLVGPRLQKPGVMECQEVVVSKKQNTTENGYGNTLVPTTKSLFLNFYGEASLTYEQMKDQFNNTEKFSELINMHFNKMTYKRRLALSFDTFLIEANTRARSAARFAYLHVVGIGLGVWRIFTGQNKIFMDTFAERIKHLSKNLDWIDTICFSYIKEESCGTYKHNEVIPILEHRKKGIKIHIFDRDPHEKLKDEYEGHLLVASYAWDGNALPGNEFWWGSLDTSGDPAAACSTQVAELHNPHINPILCGNNLRIATPKGCLTINEYREMANAQISPNSHRRVCGYL